MDIKSQSEKIEDLLSDMDDVINSARSVPFSNKISIEKEALFDIIDDIRAIAVEMRKNLPREIEQARRVLLDRENLTGEARAKAEMIIKAAEAEANKMLNEHEITRQAREFAAQITHEASEEANTFKLSAAQYIDGIFHDLDGLMRQGLEDHIKKFRDIEDFYTNIIDELYENRKQIRIDDN